MDTVSLIEGRVLEKKTIWCDLKDSAEKNNSYSFCNSKFDLNFVLKIMRTCSVNLEVKIVKYWN